MDMIFPVVWYGSKTWFLKLRQECRLKVFENRVLRKVLGPKVIEGNCIVKGFMIWWCLPSINRLTKLRGMWWTGYVAVTGDGVVKPERKKSPLARPGRKWETYQYGSLRNRLGRLGFI
jgi:hypothetical protein